jgi:hypothetical protein
VESASVPAQPVQPQEDEDTLKAGAIGFIDGLSIGLASTAPAYSLAAVIGSVVVVVGVQAPAALLTAFIPMFLIAGAFFYMNRADPTSGRRSRGSPGQWAHMRSAPAQRLWPRSRSRAGSATGS